MPNLVSEATLTTLKILLVDSDASSRSAIGELLRKNGNIVTSCPTSVEAFQQLAVSSSYSLILKDYSPNSNADACRFLRRLKALGFAHIPVVVISAVDEREAVMSCLMLGAVDYMVKPLRQNELRHIWTRVWLWQKASTTLCQGALQRANGDLSDAAAAAAAPQQVPHSVPGSGRAMSWDASQETKCVENGPHGSKGNAESDGPEGSKEGSAPDVLNADGGSNGTNEEGGRGSNGSKDENETSRLQASVRRHHHNHRLHGGAGQQATLDNTSGNQVGNSATKHVSNGNGASTTLHDGGRNALGNTAEGRLPLTRWTSALRHHHQQQQPQAQAQHEAPPGVSEQPAGCATESEDRQQRQPSPGMSPEASPGASPSPDAGSGVETAIPDRQSEPHTQRDDPLCPAASASRHCGRSAFVAVGAKGPHPVSTVALSGRKRPRGGAPRQHPERQQDSQRRDVPGPADASRAAAARLSRHRRTLPSAALPPILPLNTAQAPDAVRDTHDTPRLAAAAGAGSAYQQHHSQPASQAHSQHRRPVQVLYCHRSHSQRQQRSGQQQQPHASDSPSVPAVSSGAPPPPSSTQQAQPTQVQLLQLIASHPTQRHLQQMMGPPKANHWAGQLTRGGAPPHHPHHPRGAVTMPSHHAASAVPSAAGKPSHAASAPQLLRPALAAAAAAPPAGGDPLGAMCAETSAAAMAASAAAAAAFHGAGLGPAFPLAQQDLVFRNGNLRAVGRPGLCSSADRLAGQGGGGANTAAGAQLDPLAAMSAFLQQLSHEHYLASTQRSHESSGGAASLGGPSPSSSPEASLLHPQLIHTLMQTLMQQSRHVSQHPVAAAPVIAHPVSRRLRARPVSRQLRGNLSAHPMTGARSGRVRCGDAPRGDASDPSASSKFQLLQQELHQQLHTQQKQQMQLQEQQQHFNLHQQQHQQTVLLHHQQQQQQQQHHQHATAAFPSAPLPPHPFLTLQQQSLLHHSQHQQHQVTHLHHMMYQQQQQLLQQQQQMLLHDHHHAHLRHQQQQQQLKRRRSDTHAANQGEVTSPAGPPASTNAPHRLSGDCSTDPGVPGAPITAAETTTLLLQQHLVRSMQAARAAAAAAAAAATGAILPGAGAANAGLSESALLLLDPRQRRALALAKYRKKRKTLNFAKTIRYENRQQLAQQRVRVKGQFVKKGVPKAGTGGLEEVATTSGAASDMEEEAVTGGPALPRHPPAPACDSASASECKPGQPPASEPPHPRAKGAGPLGRVLLGVAAAGAASPTTPCSRTHNPLDVAGLVVGVGDAGGGAADPHAAGEAGEECGAQVGFALSRTSPRAPATHIDTHRSRAPAAAPPPPAVNLWHRCGCAVRARTPHPLRPLPGQARGSVLGVSQCRDHPGQGRLEGLAGLSRQDSPAPPRQPCAAKTALRWLTESAAQGGGVSRVCRTHLQALDTQLEQRVETHTLAPVRAPSRLQPTAGVAAALLVDLHSHSPGAPETAPRPPHLCRHVSSSIRVQINPGHGALVLTAVSVPLPRRAHTAGRQGHFRLAHLPTSPSKPESARMAAAAGGAAAAVHIALQQHHSHGHHLHLHHHHHHAMHRESPPPSAAEGVHGGGKNGSESGSNSPDEAFAEIAATRRVQKVSREACCMTRMP
ncbi:MAG: hypothetical protein WDW38_009616 [Sanguina aurantia]